MRDKRRKGRQMPERLPECRCPKCKEVTTHIWRSQWCRRCTKCNTIFEIINGSTGEMVRLAELLTKDQYEQLLDCMTFEACLAFLVTRDLNVLCHARSPCHFEMTIIGKGNQRFVGHGDGPNDALGRAIHNLGHQICPERCQCGDLSRVG